MVKPLATSPISNRLSTKQHNRLRALVEEHGVRAVAKAARIDTQTVTRALAEIPLRAGSVAALLSLLEAQK